MERGENREEVGNEIAAKESQRTVLLFKRTVMGSRLDYDGLLASRLSNTFVWSRLSLSG